jgi:hypothetical protein
VQSNGSRECAPDGVPTIQPDLDKMVGTARRRAFARPTLASTVKIVSIDQRQRDIRPAEDGGQTAQHDDVLRHVEFSENSLSELQQLRDPATIKSIAVRVIDRRQ